jgi:hypothetical protein
MTEPASPLAIPKTRRPGTPEGKALPRPPARGTQRRGPSACREPCGGLRAARRHRGEAGGHDTAQWPRPRTARPPQRQAGMPSLPGAPRRGRPAGAAAGGAREPIWHERIVPLGTNEPTARGPSFAITSTRMKSPSDTSEPDRDPHDALVTAQNPISSPPGLAPLGLPARRDSWSTIPQSARRSLPIRQRRRRRASRPWRLPSGDPTRDCRNECMVRPESARLVRLWPSRVGVNVSGLT